MKIRKFLAIFFILLFPLAARAVTLFDNFEDSDDFGSFYSVNWLGQTFTASDNYTLKSISIKAYRQGNPGTVTIALRGTSGGLPTGSNLTSGTSDGDLFTTDTNGDWYSFTVTDYEISSGTVYSIIGYIAAGDASNRVKWLGDWSGPTYTGGNFISSSDSGANWSNTAGTDNTFRTYGDALAPTPTPDATSTMSGFGLWGYISTSTYALANQSGVPFFELALGFLIAFCFVFLIAVGLSRSFKWLLKRKF